MASQPKSCRHAAERPALRRLVPKLRRRNPISPCATSALSEGRTVAPLLNSLPWANIPWSLAKLLPRGDAS